jgi:hypothetical protein
MKKKVILLFLISILIIVVFSINTAADIGPKPSVVIDFEGFLGRDYYVTLLADVQSSGNNRTVDRDGRSRYKEGDANYQVFKKFLDFAETDADAEGYYFLQWINKCSEDHRFSWTYYPPDKFKILIYFADSDSFAISKEAYERYAFDSYFRVSLTDAEISATNRQNGTLYFSAVKSYDYSSEILSIIVRIILTIVIELLIALLFMFRRKRQLVFIAAVNLVTQVMLNISLSIIIVYEAPFSFVLFYIVLEMLVFGAEALLYTIFLQKFSSAPIPKWKPVTYALLANAVSFAVGLSLAQVIPGNF